MKNIKCITAYLVEKVLNVTISALLLFTWFQYMLLMSDGPKLFTEIDREELILIFFIFLFLFFLIILQIIILKKNNHIGSHMVIVFGMLSVILWIRSYKGTNFTLVDELLCFYEKTLTLIGISINMIAIAFQIILTIIFVRK